MKAIATTLFLLIPAHAANAAITDPANTEPLKGYRLYHDGVEFFVSSGGCTKKSSFSVQKSKDNPAVMSLLRIVPDYCEAYLKDGISVKYSWKELSLEPGENFILGGIPSQNFVPSLPQE